VRRSREPHGDIPYFEELSAGHERTPTWQHHHDLLGCWPPSAPQVPDPLLRREGWDRTHVPNVAAQAGPYGIRVNCIAPETILTERNLERIPKEQLASLADTHPLKRLGTPEDVACAARLSRVR